MYSPKAKQAPARYIRLTHIQQEWICYLNEEKMEYLYMNPSGVHYRKLRRVEVNQVDHDNTAYEIVDLHDKSYLNLLEIKEK